MIRPHINVVEIENVTKTFGRHVAVNSLTLAVPQGSIYGFIGPNGSGKTTTLRMIMRIYHPDPGAGAIRVLGELASTAASDRVGYLPEERGLYKRMKVSAAIFSTRDMAVAEELTITLQPRSKQEVAASSPAGRIRNQTLLLIESKREDCTRNSRHFDGMPATPQPA